MFQKGRKHEEPIVSKNTSDLWFLRLLIHYINFSCSVRWSPRLVSSQQPTVEQGSFQYWERFPLFFYLLLPKIYFHCINASQPFLNISESKKLGSCQLCISFQDSSQVLYLGKSRLVTSVCKIRISKRIDLTQIDKIGKRAQTIAVAPLGEQNWDSKMVAISKTPFETAHLSHVLLLYNLCGINIAEVWQKSNFLLIKSNCTRIRQLFDDC